MAIIDECMCMYVISSSSRNVAIINRYSIRVIMSHVWWRNGWIMVSITLAFFTRLYLECPTNYMWIIVQVIVNIPQ
jgi:hypothetical protein